MGFIGSCFVSYLNSLGHHNIIVVDDFYKWAKEKNLDGKRVHDWIHRDLFLNHFEKLASQVKVVFHLGARTDTISEDKAIFDQLNLHYSQGIWDICTRFSIPLIYASSAATYGADAILHGKAPESAAFSHIPIIRLRLAAPPVLENPPRGGSYAGRAEAVRIRLVAVRAPFFWSKLFGPARMTAVSTAALVPSTSGPRVARIE